MQLVIVGASARAAAHSALRAGLQPVAVDLFTDCDLVSMAIARRIESQDYPLGLESLVDELPRCPWMYTGALENHPDLVDRIAAKRTLWGNPGQILRAVRDPFLLESAMRDAGLPSLPVQKNAIGLPRDGSWLVKPLASAGGRRISPFLPETASPSHPFYLQQRIAAENSSYSAVFVGDKRKADVMGVTLQRIGLPFADFAYRGSIGPIDPRDVLSDPEQLIRIGSVLTREFGLRGLFGVDFIVKDRDAYLVEVNPRYTASVEVLELGLGRSLIAEHLRAFEVFCPRLQSARRPAIVGKEILFATNRCRLTALDAWKCRAGGSFAVPPVADVPAPGLVFEPGEPILTVLARGSSIESTENRLQRRLDRWRSRLIPIPE